jgi:hypothetical protein
MAEGLDLGALKAHVAAQAGATSGKTRQAYARLGKALARPDRAGLADEFAKLKSVAKALGGTLSGDETLAAALDVQLALGLDALAGEWTSLVQVSAWLESPAHRDRCEAAAEKGRDGFENATTAREAGDATGCASFGVASAKALKRGLALATKLLDKQNRRPAKWSVPLSELGGMLLGVWVEPGPTPGVYTVGADTQDGLGPLFLRMGAEGWVRVPIAPSGALWSVNGIDDQVYAAGTSGRVVRYDPATGGVTDLSIGVNAPLYGVWGSSTSDVWVAGGNVDGTEPTTVLYHHDGTSWTPVAPPAAADDLTLFDVWGEAADDVWACGEGGLVLHFDGSAWTGGPSAPLESLFAIHGAAPTIAVGGTVEPTIVEGNASSFTPTAVPVGSETLRGVFGSPKGDAWASGLGGTVLRRTRGAWRPVTDVPSVPGNDLHAVSLDDAGGVYLVGGDLLGLDKGSLLYFGPRTLPTTVFPQAKLSEKIAPLLSADHGVYRVWSCATAGCHVAATPSAELNLYPDSHTMWTQFVNVPSTQSPLFRVLPGRPSQSYLLHKLAGTQRTVAGSGETMPYGGPYLSQDDMDTIGAWILEGAPDN